MAIFDEEEITRFAERLKTELGFNEVVYEKQVTDDLYFMYMMLTELRTDYDLDRPLALFTLGIKEHGDRFQDSCCNNVIVEITIHRVEVKENSHKA